MSHRGFSLLEVILALAILAGTIVVLGEVSRLGMESARSARDITQAQLMCESVMAEIVAGIQPAQSTQGTMPSESGPVTNLAWVYSVDIEAIEEELISVRVTVAQDLPPNRRPVQCSLVRWLIDPEAVAQADAEAAAAEESATAESGQSSGMASGGTGDAASGGGASGGGSSNSTTPSGGGTGGQPDSENNRPRG